MLEKPDRLVELDFGGWVPTRLESSDLVGASVSAQEVHSRNKLRAVKNWELADLIKRTIVGGSTELQDFVDGTIFYFSSVTLLDA